MSVIKNLNLALAFFLEIGLLVIFGYRGVTLSDQLSLKVLMGIGFPIILVLVWGKWLAPASTSRLKEPGLVVVKGAIFTTAALVLFFIGMTWQAVLFEILSVLNLILLYIYR